MRSNTSEAPTRRAGVFTREPLSVNSTNEAILSLVPVARHSLPVRVSRYNNAPGRGVSYILGSVPAPVDTGITSVDNASKETA